MMKRRRKRKWKKMKNTRKSGQDKVEMLTVVKVYITKNIVVCCYLFYTVTEVMQNIVGGEDRDTDNEVNVVIATAEGDDNDSEDDDDPPRPPTMIDDDIELTHLVNEAVDSKKGSFKET